MSFARRFATLASAVAAALAVLLVIATPARAEGEVDVSIDGLSGSVRAGASSEDFRATFTNESNSPIPGVYVVVAVSFPGAPTEDIHVQRSRGADLPSQVTGDGVIAFTDPAPFDLGRGGGNGRRRVDFFLSFGDSVPQGEAVVTVAAYAAAGLLGSASQTIEVRGSGTRTTAPNTDPGFVPTFTPGPTYSVAPLNDADDLALRSSNVPKTVYVLGSLLVVMGLVTLILIFRPAGSRAARAGAREPDRRLGPPIDLRSGEALPPPRPPHPGGFGPGAAQQWPVVARPPARPGPAGHDPGSYPGSDPGSYPGSRPKRDPRAHTDGPHTSGPHTSGPQTGAPRGSGPHPGGHHTGPAGGPHTGTGRVVRDAVPDEPPWR